MYKKSGRIWAKLRKNNLFTSSMLRKVGSMAFRPSIFLTFFLQMLSFLEKKFLSSF